MMPSGVDTDSISGSESIITTVSVNPGTIAETTITSTRADTNVVMNQDKKSLSDRSSDSSDDDDSDSEDEAAREILEESPCKRWSKRREEVNQREVQSIDCAYLAMDNETGNEVVWNEVQFSERKNFRGREEEVRTEFDRLIHLNHTNLVKFYKYWFDTKSDKPRIIFITEYMSSGSMERFLQHTRKIDSKLSLKSWKKWSTQILSALNYLHSCQPPVAHANLTCKTMFIQHNGLVKIGCVAPDIIHHHVKTFRDNIKSVHYFAPEYEHCTSVAPPADIYSFGICALEMALQTGLSKAPPGSADTPPLVSRELINQALSTLEDPMQKDFIASCLHSDASKRPSARELLSHTILFEIHSLKLLAAHRIVENRANDSSTINDLCIKNPGQIAAISKFRGMSYAEVQSFQFDLDKFIDDVDNGIYPLTSFAPLTRQKITTSVSSAALSGEQAPEDRTSDSGDRMELTPSPSTASIEEYSESRSIISFDGTLVDSTLTIVLQFSDSMKRQLTTALVKTDTGHTLAAELVQQGLVSEADQLRVSEALSNALRSGSGCFS